MSEGAPASILVVDDDEDVRALVVLQLQMSGLSVREESSVDAGLAALAADPPDIVLTDLNFGADSGERIVRRCIDIGQPVLLMTASVETRDLPPDIREAVIILRKPFSLGELADAVARGLGGDRRASP
jgi:two-component system response regulator FlrC